MNVTPELQRYLSGKQLLLDDLPFPQEVIHHYHENGYLLYREGIVKTKKGPKCQRCGTTAPHWFGEFPCARCQRKCTYCRQCLMMGRVASCTPLISWQGPAPELTPCSEPLQWTGTLSEGQAIAADRVTEAICRKQELLVWAVCGAGKTEVLFKGIDAALRQGSRVCIATPRTDVVLELTPRLKASFPEIEVASLYGGSEDRHKFAPLTIATTHQLLRFYHAFEAIIVDEVDAFPYSVEETLQYAVQQARKPESTLIYLTATPSDALKRSKIDTVTIPARYHRKPLPVPTFIWCGNWEKRLETKQQLPKKFLQWIKKRLEIGKQTLVFAPKIATMEKLLPLFQALHPKILSVHAQDPERKEKVQLMRKEEIPILLTTTILERGVTFPNIDVAVLGAEDRIFTESALVQIAGRAGRSAQYPEGDVCFFHFGKTDAMVRAQKQILTMNKQAEKRGLIDV